MKKHWTQTVAGKKRMKEAMTKSWAKRRSLTAIIDGEYPEIPSISNGKAMVTRINEANSLTELQEIKAFLDLRDELLARLP